MHLADHRPPNEASAGPPRRVRTRVTGTVQGVGFRPYVYRLAAELGLAGYVRNDERGVLLEVEGPARELETFFTRLPAEAPPLAAIERVRRREMVPTGERRFAIAPSASDGGHAAAIPVDVATCDDCLRELLDPTDRRYRYPFINCTHCGPRFTIVRGTPYDRPLTAMAGFALCEECRAEYEDPADRRFHAEPTACARCGPHVVLVDRTGRELAQRDAAITAAAAALRGRGDDGDGAGKILAVKGLGGFHLACRAGDAAAVAALRERKRRRTKPFALMVRDLDEARRLVELPPEAEAALAGRERPIVLARRRPAATGSEESAAVCEAVAPGSPDLGLMLPYTPLHHLLLEAAGAPLVMTSGNPSDQPIAHRNRDALTGLAEIADLFLLHDRPIEARADDSVLRVTEIAGPDSRRIHLLPVRRSRGWVPSPLPLPVGAPKPLLACGAELKSTFCLARGDRAWLGPHVGDLGGYETRVAYRESVEHLERLLAIDPAAVAHDLHPDYASTRFAYELREQHPELELIGVQHHHAHLAAVLAEHGESGPAVGAIYDGTGYGPAAGGVTPGGEAAAGGDAGGAGGASVWGGEILAGDLRGYERLGHLWPVRLPGGDAAAREPWRMACAWLVAAGEGDADRQPPIPPALAGEVDPGRWRAVARLAATGFSAPWTTSAGRLFDAVAALCGLCARSDHEGEAAMALEAAAAAAAEAGAAEPYPMPLVPAPAGETEPGERRDPVLVLDARETVRAIAADLAAGAAAPRVAARFHAALAAATVAAVTETARRRGLSCAVLSGGVFQNRRLLETVAAGLERAGLEVFLPTRVPPNDGGIAYGQAAVAAARMAAAAP